MLRNKKVLLLTVATLVIAVGCATTTSKSRTRKMAPVANGTLQREYTGLPTQSLLPQSQKTSVETSFSEDTSSLAPSSNARRIALLLPITGKLRSSAEAVRDGFMAAFYQAGNKNQSGITVYDTNGDTDVTGAAEKALDDGADFIVGPLSKPGVAQLLNTRNLNAPVLTLNYGDANGRGSFYQFGLAPEDEARQAALQASKLGKLNAMVLAQNSDWGNRVANAFIQQWKAQGGTILKASHFEKNLAKSVSQLLEVNTSQDRANNVKRLVNSNLNFQPRRRQDIDLIFIAAYPVEARQIKPLLAFYYAGDIPVYATSSVFAGARNPKADRDLDGVVFCDSPAILTNTNLPSNMSPEEAGNKARLYALGVDAYNLLPQLSNLERYREMHFNGASGQLYLDTTGQISRALPCAQFKSGVPVAVKSR